MENVQVSLTDRLLTARIGVHLDKLTIPQLVKKFPALYGTRIFITVFTTAPPRPAPRPVTALTQIDPVHASPMPLLEDPFSHYLPIYA